MPVILAVLLSLPYLINVYIPYTGFTSDVLTGACKVSCGSVATVTSMLQRRLLPLVSLQFQHLKLQLIRVTF